MFTRLHEDPMLLIKQQQLAARKRVTENPIKMQRIREEVCLFQPIVSCKIYFMCAGNEDKIQGKAKEGAKEVEES